MACLKLGAQGLSPKLRMGLGFRVNHNRNFAKGGNIGESYELLRGILRVQTMAYQNLFYLFSGLCTKGKATCVLALKISKQNTNSLGA